MSSAVRPVVLSCPRVINRSSMTVSHTRLVDNSSFPSCYCARGSVWNSLLFNHAFPLPSFPLYPQCTVCLLFTDALYGVAYQSAVPHFAVIKQLRKHVFSLLHTWDSGSFCSYFFCPAFSCVLILVAHGRSIPIEAMHSSCCVYYYASNCNLTSISYRNICPSWSYGIARIKAKTTGDG